MISPHAPKLTRAATVSGTPCGVLSGVRRGLWLRSRKGFALFDLETDSLTAFPFAKPGTGQPFADGQHRVVAKERAIEVWDASGKRVSRVAIPKPKRHADMPRWLHQRAATVLDRRGQHVWHVGYDAQGRPVVRVYRGPELTPCGEIAAPSSRLAARWETNWQGEPEPKALLHWAEGPSVEVAYPADAPAVVWANLGDDMWFCTLYDVVDGTLTQRPAWDVEEAVGHASDARLWYVVVHPSGDRLVAFCDLSHITVVDLAGGDRTRPEGHTAWARYTDGDMVRFDGLDAGFDPYNLRVDDVVVGPDAVYVEVGSDGEDDGFPRQLFIRLDPVSLRATGYVTAEELTEGKAARVTLYDGGILTCPGPRGATQLFRW